MANGVSDLPSGTGLIKWRIKQFAEVVASGSGPESGALAEARRYIYLYEFDDATTTDFAGVAEWRNQMEKGGRRKLGGPPFDNGANR